MRMLSMTMGAALISSAVSADGGWRILPLEDVGRENLLDFEVAIRCAALARFKAGGGDWFTPSQSAQFLTRAIEGAGTQPNALEGRALHDAAEAEVARLVGAYSDTIADPDFDPDVDAKDRAFCEAFLEEL